MQLSLILITFCLIFSFIFLSYSMKKFHQLEYRKIQQNHYLTFTLIFLSLSLNIFIVFYQEKLKNSKDLTPTKIINLIKYAANFPSFLLCLSIIKWKSTEDMLQNVSKLDGLVKVSIF